MHDSLTVLKTATVGVAVEVIGHDLPEAGDGALGYRATVIDSDHQALVTTFGYALSTDVSDRLRLALHALHVDTSPREGQRRALTVTDVRDLPLARWESAARAQVLATVQGTVREAWSALSEKPNEVMAQLLVKQVYPEAIDAEGASAERRLAGLLRLAETSLEYRQLLAEGRTDPAAEIARIHKVTPSTARSWIRRARQSGFLGPAVSRTAGERSDSASFRLADD